MILMFLVVTSPADEFLILLAKILESLIVMNRTL